jgi:hypothetical protein
LLHLVATPSSPIVRNLNTKTTVIMKRNLREFKKFIAHRLGIGLAVFGLALSPAGAGAQSITATNYPVTAGTDVLVPIPLTGTTVHVASGVDDTPGPLNPFGGGFMFWYGGVPYTSLSAGPDGFLRLGTAAASQFTNDLGSTTNTPVIAPYWDDLATGTNGAVTGFLTGTAPNRIYVVNWQLTIPRNTTGAAAAAFQCWLHENGRIEFVYGNNIVAGTSYSVGFAQASGTPTRIVAGTINVPFATSTFAYVSATPNNTNTSAIANGSKLSFIPPAGSAIPTGLSFTAVGPAGMTLNWTDNATDESGYAILRSDDNGATYALIASLPANTVTYAATGLVPNKTFLWKVIAYSNDVPPAGSLNGSQATSAPGVVVSTPAGGNWSSTATWVGGVLPAVSDSVIIADGSTVTVDGTAGTCWSLKVGEGTSGVLNYGSTAATLTVNNNVYVSAGAVFSAGAGSSTSHLLRIGGSAANGLGQGSLIVNGTFDMQTTAGVPVTFFGLGNATVSGTPTVLDFRSITLNKGASTIAPPTLEILAPFTVQGANSLGLVATHTAGILKISGSFTQNNPIYTTAAYTIPAAGGFWLNNANFIVDGQNGSPTSNGLLRITSGVYNIGTAAGNALGFGTGAIFTVEGGTINASGRINTANAITFNSLGGTINVAVVGNNSSANPSFGITSTGSTANISGGTLNLVQRNTGATIIDYSVLAGFGSVTGGTLNVGTPATATNFDFRIRGAMPNVVVDNTTNNKNVVLSGATTIFGNLTLPVNDTLNLNSNVLQVSGNVSNNGHINGKGAGVLQFTGASAQNYSGSGGTDSLFRIINSNSLGGITFNKNVIAQSVFFYDSTTIHNSSNITLGYNNLPVTLQYGQAGGTKVAGQFDVLPVMNLGTGTYSVTYSQESAARTTGMEIPVSRSFRNLTINNTNGVTIAGGPITLEMGGVLTLTNGVVTASAANRINVLDTIVNAVTGFSANSYVRGSMSRQLPQSLTTPRTYSFPVGGAAYKLFELINPGTNPGGLVGIAVEAFDGNSGGVAGTDITSIDTTQYWSVQFISGASNIDSANIRVTSSGLNGLSRLTYSPAVNGGYDRISGIPASATQIRTTAYRTGPALEGFYGLGKEIVGLTGTYLVGASQSAPNYTNLTQAISDLNSKQVQGNVIYELQADYNSASETFPLTFTEPVKTSPSWTITVQPAAGTVDSIRGSFAGAIISINGMTNLILEGRQGGSGPDRSLIITNDNTGASATTVSFVNDSRHNIIRYSVVKGASATATNGVINFGTGLVTGNDSNTIDHCDIRDAAAGTPATLINSSGSTDVIAKYNDHNVVTNSNLFNFFHATAEANAFKISNGNNNWIIDNNSIYQTAPRSTSALHYTFNFQNSDNRNALNAIQVTNNHIGGSEPLCGGAPWTMTSGAGRICSFFNMGNLAMSKVSFNVFANFNCSTTSTATGSPGTWNAIQFANGMLNIDSNTIGSEDTSSIVIGAGSAGVAMPIVATATSTPGTYSISGNKIGGIKIMGGGTVSNNLNVITIASSSNTITYNVNNNVIGNEMPDNIYAELSNSSTAQGITGIANTSSANLHIRNNVIRNITNNYTGTSTTGRVIGISTTSGKDSIVANQIRTLRSSTPQTGSGVNSSVIGISFTSTNGGSLISRNVVYGLANNTPSAGAKVTGIYYSGGTADFIGRNFVHSFSTYTTSPASQQTGINFAGGTSSVVNNMIRLGVTAAGADQMTTPSIIGLHKSGGTMNAYFNTVYVGGANVVDSVVRTFAFSRTASNPDTVYNNIFVNQRSNAGAGGGHFAIGLNNLTGWVANNNVYYVNGTGDSLALLNTTVYQGLGDWKLATSKDAASIFGNPSFVNATGDSLAVSLHLTGATPAEGTGIPVASVTIDFDGDTRSGLTPTDIGADAGNFTPVDLSPPSISFAPIANDTITPVRSLTSYFTIADASGVKLTGANAPRFYFKKKTDNDMFGGNTSADNGWKYVSIANLSSPYSFNIDYSIINGGSVSIGDTIQYFIVAQDSAVSPNVGAIPSTGFVASSVSSVVAAPSNPGFYAIVPYPLGGLYTVGTSAPADFPTITAALASASAYGVKAPVTFSLIDPAYNVTTGETFPLVVNPIKNTSAVNTVTISPAASVHAVVTAPNNAAAVFKFLNASYVTLDGLNTGGSSLSLVDSNTTTATAGVWLASTATTGPGNRNVGIRNLSIMGGSNSVATSFGIIAAVDGATPSATAGMNNDSITIAGNTILRAYYGIYANGTAAVSAGGLDALRITGNTIGPDTFNSNSIGLAGIWVNNALALTIAGDTVRYLDGSTRTGVGAVILSNVNGATIARNKIRNITGSGSVSGTGSIVGILLGSATNNITVSRNTIRAISNTATGGWGVRGLIINSGSAANNITLSNNQISDIWSYSDGGSQYWPVGIHIDNSASAVNLYYNTVNIHGSRPGLTSASGSAALFVNSASGTLDIRNNVFVNTYDNNVSTTDIPYAFYSAVGNNVYSNINYNDYYAAGLPTAVIGYLGSAQTTIAGLRTATGQDAASVSVNPLFVSNTDMRPGLGIVTGLGTTIAGITHDIIDSLRGTPPSMGAFEYGVDASGPAISYTLINNTSNTSGYVLTGFAAMTDITGVDVAPGTAPRLYYKKRSENNVLGSYPSDNNGSFNGWKYVEATNTTSPFDFTIDYTLLTGGTVVQGVDTIQYFVTAQDISTPVSYVSANPSAGFAATSVNTITAAPSAPNFYVITNAPLAGPYNVGAGLSFPDYPTITAAVADMNLRGISAAVTFNLMDASYTTPAETFPIVINPPVGSSDVNTVTIKPSAGVTTTVTGNSASSIFKINGADYIIMDGSNNGTTSHNMTVENTNASGVVLWIASTPTGYGATHNTVKNMAITGGSGTTTIAGILAGTGTTLGSAADSANSYNTITNNVFTKTQNGIFALGNANAAFLDKGWVISNNVFGSATVADKLGFRGAAIQNASAFRISGNTIMGVVTSTTSLSCGILAGAALDSGVIEKNMISDIKNTNTTGYGAAGIYLNASTAASNVTVKNNFIFDVTGNGYASGAGPNDNGNGIMIANGGGYNLYFNTVNMNTNQAVAGRPAALNVASTVTAPSSLDIRNNIFMIPQSVSGERYALYFGAANSVIGTMDYNVFFSSSANLANINATNINSLAGIQANFGGNIKSIIDSTNFVSATDLRLSGTSIGNLAYSGTPIAGITTDIEGDVRSATHPYRGADENPNNPLPVQFISFTAAAQASDVKVSWSTASEINNKGFEVQRSVDGRSFEAAGFVKGAGNSSLVLNYGFTDARAFDKTNSNVLYYRLKQVDFSGASEYTNIVKVVKHTSKANGLSAFPNPFSDSYSVSFEAAATGTATLTMIDIQGKQIAVQNTAIASGYNAVKFEAPADLKPGVYFVKVTVEGETQVLKLVKN